MLNCSFSSFYRPRTILALTILLATAAPRVRAQESPSSPEKVTPQTEAAASGATGEHEEDDLLLPMKRDLWFQKQRAYPNAHIPRGAMWHALQQRQALIGRRRLALRALPAAVAAQADPFSSVTWTADGPQPAAGYNGSGAYSGRATSIAVHPTDPNTVYLGTAAGGVWKTTDGGATWTPLTDTQSSLAIGAVAIDPNNPNTVFAGTGEPDFSLDSYYGQGLLKSTDAGSTWTLIRSPFTTGDTAPDFTQIAVQPGSSNIVLAANLAGLYRSADGGSTWSEVLNPGGDAGVTAVIFDVKNPSIAYAGIGGYYATLTGTVYRSTDAGATWNSISGSGTGALPAPSAVIRTALAEDANGKLYAAVANSQYTAPGLLYATTNSGTSWTKLSSPSASDGLDWYRNAIAVSPTNPQVLYASGASLYQSMDGGQTWAVAGGGVAYADQHGFAFSADGSRMYVADDGGIFVTTAPTTANPAFTSLNTALNTMTFYPGFSLMPGSTPGLLAGSQDHGLNLYQGALAWPNGEYSGYCGDGGSVYVDPKGTYAYAHCEGGYANWTANATGDTVTTSWVAAVTGINTSDRMPWVADIKGDPKTLATVYTVTDKLYQSTNNAGAWTAISGDLTGGNSTLTTIAIAPSNSNIVYTGAGDGTVSMTSNALSGTSAAWKTLTGLPNRSISKILVAPNSAQDVYAAIGGFGSGHILHSTNGGGTWTDISGDLPDTPADSVVLDPSLLHTLYLATDTGVYVTTNGGTNWTLLGQGLPNVVVQDALMDPATRILHVITHGRGAWEATLPLVGLSASANSLPFANQTQGTTSAAQMVTLTNNLSTGTLTLGAIQITGPFTETSNCGTSLGSGASCAVNVSFAPATPGAMQGSLAVTSTSDNLTIALSGTGLGIPAAALGSSSLAFNSQPAGIASAGQTVQLSNTGDATLGNVALTVTGANAGDFSQSNNCGTSLNAGASCTISVVFTPGATGSRSASISIADNAPGAPQTIALSGTGSAPFTFTAASNTASVAPGASASYQLTATAAQGTKFASAISLSCSGLPSEASCSFTPSSVSTGSTTQNVTLTIVTTPASSPAHASLGRAGGITLAAFSLLSLLVLPRRRWRLWMVLLAAVCLGIPGCGGGGGTNGGGNNNQGTPAGSYTVVVTAAQSTVYQTTRSLTLTVQ